jgi:hypothetical protein
MTDLLHTRAWEVQESPIDLGYRVVPGWGKLPDGWSLGQVSGVATDSKNRIYVFHRGSDAPPLICLDSDGTLLSSYEKLSFGRPHMVVCDADDNIWLADDGSHIIYKLSPDGEVLFTLGIKDVPGEDGIHFNQPMVTGALPSSMRGGNSFWIGVRKERNRASSRFLTVLSLMTKGRFM